MTEDERARVLGGMRGTSRRVFELLGEHGPLSDAELRARTGRNGSMNDRLEPLLEAGLIRPVAARGTRRYEQSPPAEVEEAARRWSVRRRKKKRRGARPPLSALRKMVPGVGSRFYQEMTWITQTGSRIRASEMQVFWEQAPFHDLELMRPFVEDMIEAGQAWLESFEVRRDEEDRRRKLTKMENTNGRTDHELRVIAVKKAQLEEELL
jgi:hypothetical protein